MKRDMALVRQILLKTEQNTEVSGWIDLDIEGYSPEEISYHVKLLAEAELIEAQDLTTMEEFEWKPKG